MRALAAVELAAHDALGVLHRDPALGIVDDDYEHDYRQGADYDEREGPPGEAAVGDVGDHGADGAGEAGDDAREQDDGDAVADTELGDLLAHPHDERGAGHEGHDDDDGGPHAGAVRGEHALAVDAVLDEHVVGKAHDEADAHGGVAGDGGELLAAFLAAFLLQPLKGRDGYREQLDDDGGVDVRLDGQRKDGCHREAAAGHGVPESEYRVVDRVEVALQHGRVDVRHGDGVAKTVYENDEQREEYFLAKLLDAPRILESLKHLIPPRPFRPPPLSFALQIRRRRKP